jgi:hypothetical protein
MKALKNCRLGETPGVIEVTSGDEARDAALALARQARQGIDIVSRHLDPRLYDTPELIEALKALALGSRRTRVRVLVQDVLPILRDGHRLVALAQRIPTYVHIRVPAPQHQDFNRAFLVADGTGYLHRELADRFEGTVSFYDLPTARDLLRQFEPLWEAAEPELSLRVLGI